MTGSTKSKNWSAMSRYWGSCWPSGTGRGSKPRPFRGWLESVLANCGGRKEARNPYLEGLQITLTPISYVWLNVQVNHCRNAFVRQHLHVKLSHSAHAESAPVTTSCELVLVTVSGVNCAGIGLQLFFLPCYLSHYSWLRIFVVSFGSAFGVTAWLFSAYMCGKSSSPLLFFWWVFACRSSLPPFFQILNDSNFSFHSTKRVFSWRILVFPLKIVLSAIWVGGGNRNKGDGSIRQLLFLFFSVRKSHFQTTWETSYVR